MRKLLKFIKMTFIKDKQKTNIKITFTTKNPRQKANTIDIEKELFNINKIVDSQ